MLNFCVGVEQTCAVKEEHHPLDVTESYWAQHYFPDARATTVVRHWVLIREGKQKVAKVSGAPSVSGSLGVALALNSKTRNLLIVHKHTPDS